MGKFIYSEQVPRTTVNVPRLSNMRLSYACILQLARLSRVVPFAFICFPPLRSSVHSNRVRIVGRARAWPAVLATIYSNHHGRPLRSIRLSGSNPVELHPFAVEPRPIKLHPVDCHQTDLDDQSKDQNSWCGASSFSTWMESQKRSAKQQGCLGRMERGHYCQWR